MESQQEIGFWLFGIGMFSLGASITWIVLRARVTAILAEREKDSK